MIRDAVVAQSAEQAAALWQLRESISPAQKPEGVRLKHDVSVPVSRIAEFVERASLAVFAVEPGARIVAFGHIAMATSTSTPACRAIPVRATRRQGRGTGAFTALRSQLARVVYDLDAPAVEADDAEPGLPILS